MNANNFELIKYIKIVECYYNNALNKNFIKALENKKYIQWIEIFLNIIK